MKSRTSGILVVCFAIALANNFGTSIEVSSMVDLDPDESTGTSDQDDPIPVLHVSRSAMIGRRRGSEFAKASEPRKRRIYFPRVSSVIIIARSFTWEIDTCLFFNTESSVIDISRAFTFRLVIRCGINRRNSGSELTSL